MQKYALGDEVKIEVKGKVVQAEMKSGVVFYRIQGNTADCFWITDNEIVPLEVPKES